MMILLTDEEIKLLGEGTSGTWQDDLQFARAIEAAVIKKLSEQSDPVAIVGDVYQLMWFGSSPIAAITSKHGIRVGDKLYTHPAPPPEGYQLVPIEPTEAMVAAGQEIAHELITANCCKSMNGLGGGKTWQEFKNTCKNLELCEMYLNNDIDSVEAIYRAMLAAAKEMK